MHYNFTITTKVQYRGYVEATSEEEAKKLIMSVDWDEAEQVGAINVQSIDDIEQIEGTK
ncbi:MULTISPECIES: hypothetical protein [unclassified Holdemanella]|uniref:hypothetical protein n=1 Tax=unclassified Holdemanella TaxID=2633909 RepID=UPI001D0BBD06|nr:MULTISPECIES: hypothetical protein [unclassified Holdemanella]MCB8640037.1 hypothetical protein [Holdemanella sp. DFI.5.55]MCG5648820.1 hypothetical protein [Holdemanella sp. DFI.5.21]